MPAKGRLQENAEAFFARAGLELVKPRGARDYRGAIADLPGVEVAYLSAAEITQLLAQGAVHFGVTGEDLVREMIPDADARIVFIDALGFGHANVVVAVPQAWIDVHGMADLDDVATAFRLKHDRKMRVATKYVNLTRDFFSAHGITDYRIVESSGATEGAPAAGTAELIVDITTTGATLAANGLKVIEDGVDPALAGQSGGGARRPTGARPRARPPRARARPHRRAGAGARLSRGAHALCGCDDALLAEAKMRFGVESAVRRPTSSGMLTLHCPPARCTRSRASCARTAPRTSRSPISATCSRATIRSMRGSRPGSAVEAETSLARDVRRLDDRPPLLDLGLLQGAERFRGLLVARRNLQAERRHAVAHGRIGHGVDRRGVELGDDVAGRSLRHPQSIPDRDVEPGHAGLVHGRDVGRRRPAAPWR